MSRTPDYVGVIAISGVLLQIKSCLIYFVHFPTLPPFCFSFLAAGGTKIYFGLKLLNKAGSDIILKSSDANPKNGFKIKQGLAVQITKTVALKQPVMFFAVDMKGGKVLLNNRAEFIMKPSPLKGKPFTVSITPGEGRHVVS